MSLKEFEWAVVGPAWWQISANQLLTLMPHVQDHSARFAAWKKGIRKKSIHEERGKEKKTWLCCCRRGLNLLKISVAALCFFFLSYKWRCPENSSIRQNDFTCCPRDRECWLGSHVSFFSCCLLSLSPKQWLWETVGALMCLCWGHQWCHQLHCHVYMTHWVPDTHRRLLSCFHVC